MVIRATSTAMTAKEQFMRVARNTVTATAMMEMDIVGDATPIASIITTLWVTAQIAGHNAPT